MMLPHEFDEGIDRMLAYWGYQKSRWNDEICAEYRRAFENWSVGRWLTAIGSAIDQGHYFPRISELRKYGKVEEVPEAEEEKRVESCEHCALGRITFGKLVNGMVYEKYLACDCPAGDAALAGMLSIAHRLRHSVDVARLRYSVVFADCGGLSTAKSGHGLGLGDDGMVTARSL